LGEAVVSVSCRWSVEAETCRWVGVGGTYRRGGDLDVSICGLKWPKQLSPGEKQAGTACLLVSKASRLARLDCLGSPNCRRGKPAYGRTPNAERKARTITRTSERARLMNDTTPPMADTPIRRHVSTYADTFPLRCAFRIAKVERAFESLGTPFSWQ
jgi:hypothetical protein